MSHSAFASSMSMNWGRLPEATMSEVDSMTRSWKGAGSTEATWSWKVEGVVVVFSMKSAIRRFGWSTS